MGEALQLLRPGPAADRRRDQRTLRFHSRLLAGDSGRMSEVRLRLHGESGHEAAAAGREEHGEREFTGASDRGEVGRSSATTSAGKAVRTAWRADLAQNDGRLDG